MPQSTQKNLVRVLLWWTVILSITQAVFVVLFFTLGHFGKSQDSSAEKNIQEAVSTPSPESGGFRDKAKMFTFKAKVYNKNNLNWYAVEAKDHPINLTSPDVFSVRQDGYFFMCLRITLVLQNCNKIVDKVTVTLRIDNEDNKDTLVEGWIDNKTCSTGVLCKMKYLTAQSILKVEIDNIQDHQIDDKLSVSYLDVIFMPKHISSV